jgi:hypothetical protein
MEQACGRTFFLTDATIEASRPQRPDAVPFARSAVARVGGFEDADFVLHYHEDRPRQGLRNELIAPLTTLTGTGHVTCRDRLGRLLKFYYREAA